MKEGMEVIGASELMSRTIVLLISKAVPLLFSHELEENFVFWDQK
jgi:hypothetical protein